MNFCIDADQREAIRGWLTPDNPSVKPRFIVEIPGRPPIEFDANVMRQDILDLGWHSTGQVGFSLDCELIADLGEIEDVRLIDYHTGMTIYRRAPLEEYISGRLLFYDCSLMPQWRLLGTVARKFAVHYSTVDRYPLETALAIFWNQMATSSFVSGAPNFLRYCHAFQAREFRTVALLREPIEELAERLMFLRALARSPSLSSIRTHFDVYEPLIAFADSIDPKDRKSLLGGFRSVDNRARALMRSPMTRTFGAEVTDSPEYRQVTAALDNLATVDLVGVRTNFREFSGMFDGLLGKPMLSGAAFAQVPGTEDLAALLKTIGPAIDLLEEDIALYAYACDAIVSQLESAGQ